MTQKVESPAALGDRASNDALLLAGSERHQPSPNSNQSQRQTEACSPIQTEIVGGVCDGRPICVLVAAVCEQPERVGARRAARHSLIAEVS